MTGRIKQSKFQFTPLREGRREGIPSLYSPHAISIHAPPRGATFAPPISTPKLKFQFTPLREGRRANPLPCGWLHHFNSRPSARGDVALVLWRLRLAISIHAPPRGATEWADFTGDFFRISIHAPPRGATARSTPARKALPYFNSRPSARGDACGLYGKPLPAISIHAPPRGATQEAMSQGKGKLFQFTPLREGRHGDVERRGAVPHFNSRPSARGDASTAARGSWYPAFQFTPLREGRPDKGCSFYPHNGYFNSRPSARGDANVPTI